MCFQVEEEVEEADMMDQPMKDERSRRVFKECEEKAKKRSRQQGRGEQLLDGNVHSGFGRVYVSSPRRRSAEA